MYGKLENGSLIIAPKDVIFGEKRVFNPSEDILSELGYLPVAATPMPEVEDGCYASPSWEEKDEQIVKVWTVLPIEPSEPTIEERVGTLELDVTETKEALDMILSGVTE